MTRRPRTSSIADASVRDALVALNDDDREVLMLNAWDGLDTHALGDRPFDHHERRRGATFQGPGPFS